MKNFEQYGRIKERRRKKDVRKDMENKEPEKEEIKRNEKREGYYSRFANINVSLKLINGETLTGTLVTDSYNRYDVILRTEDAEVLLPKHSILWLKKHEE